jgi:2'-5' RNA ligase
METVQTALCIIPSENCCLAIDSVRRFADKAFPRWMPHINLIYPFLPEDSPALTAYFRKLQRYLSEVEPFDIILKDVGTFPQSDGPTIHLRPEAGESSALTSLYAAVVGPYPVPQRKPFVPHLTIAQFPLPNDRDHGVLSGLNEKALMKHLSSRFSLQFRVAEICFISRTGNKPFEVKKRFPLGVQESCRILKTVRRPVPEPGSQQIPNFLENLAAQMAAQWIRRMLPEKLPKTKEKLLHSLATFCRIKVPLRVDDLMEIVIRDGIIALTTIKKSSPTPGALVANARGRGGRGAAPVARGRAGARGRGAAPVARGRGAAMTVIETPGVRILQSGKTHPGPAQLQIGDAAGLEQRVRFFFSRLATQGKVHSLQSVKKQLQQVAVLTATVDGEVVLGKLISQGTVISQRSRLAYKVD